MQVFSAKLVSTNQENTRNRIVFLLLLCAALVSPWLALVSMGIIARGMLNERIGRPALAITLVGFLAFFNATKRIDGDWFWYVTDYLNMLHVDFFEYMEGGGVSVREIEPAYYAGSFVLARLSGGNVFILAIAVSLVVYLTYLFALERLMKSVHIPRWPTMGCIVFAMLAGLTFTQSLHLVRQYMAGSVMFLYFVFILDRQYKKATMLFVLGALIHSSFVIPAGLVTISAYLWRQSWVKSRYYLVAFLLLCIGYGSGTYISQILTNDAGTLTEILASQDDGSISTAVLLFDAVLFFATLMGVVFHRGRPGFYAAGSEITVFFLMCFGGFLLGVYDVKLWFLRLYFYIEWFRVIGVITIVWYLIFRMRLAKLTLLIIPLSFLIFEMRVTYSPFNYGGGVFVHLTQSVVWWVNEIALTQ